MALSAEQRKLLRMALASPGDDGIADQIADLIDSGGNPVADAVAALGATSNFSALVPVAASISASAGTYAIPAEPTGAEVDAAIDEASAKVETALDAKADNADVETLRGQIESRMDAAEAKIDEVIAAMKAAGQMNS